MTCYTCVVRDYVTGVTYQVAAHDLITGPTLKKIIRRRFGRNVTIAGVRTWPDTMTVHQAMCQAFDSQ